MAGERWIEVTPSEFAHEAEGLNIVKALLPDEPGYRAWSNFEFRDSNGLWSEVDLLLLTPAGLHLVELKWYSGTIRGNDSTWLRSGGRAEDSPLKLARRKAQRLASKLKDAFNDWVRENKVTGAPPANRVIPWVQEAVFLHHESVRVLLPPESRQDLYGLEGKEHQSNLPDIGALIDLPPNDYRRGEASDKLLAELLAKIGLVRAPRTAGSWVLDGEAMGDGEGWQDWGAFHSITKEQARIRFTVAKPGSSAEDISRRNRIAVHEARTVGQLNHENIVRLKDAVEGDLGIGLVYEHDDNRRRLDLWMAEHDQGIPLEQQLSILRQVGDALTHAHNNKVVHRGIDPHAIVIIDGAKGPKALVGEWQTVGALSDPDSVSPTATGVTKLFQESSTTLPGFAAPEGALMRQIDRIRVDVFGLGALAFYLLTGQSPAPSDRALVERLRQQGGLDVSAELPQVASHIREAILNATRPAVSERTADVATFINELTKREEPTLEQVDPIEATAGDLLDNRFLVERRLGAGSTAVGLLVKDTTTEKQRVLKVAIDDSARARLDDEAEVLAKLDSPRMVKLIDGPIDVAGRRALLLSNAGQETLAHRLRNKQRIVLDLLERWGLNVLDALVALDAAGITHRDIKPANLGILESTKDKAKELMLFDFSLSRAPASSVTAGTPPYLDPFLTGKRTYDSAAERYAAAVVLFEMATGHTPVFGDGASDPAAINDEATINPEDFDPTVGQRLAKFFSTALRRDASKRHLTAQEMRAAWLECFPSTETEVPPEADTLADKATPESTLSAAGLSGRARSALEPYGVITVGDLLALDPAVVNRMGGAKLDTRREVQGRLKLWRQKFGSMERTSTREAESISTFELADLFLDAVRGKRATTRFSLVAQILGREGEVDAFASTSELAKALDVTPMRISQLMPELQETWGANEETRQQLEFLLETVDDALLDLGGVATTARLADSVAATLVPEEESDERDLRLVEGLVRLAAERRKALAAVNDELNPHVLRRGAGYVLISEDQALLDIAQRLGQEADRLVRNANPGDSTNQVVSTTRASEALQQFVTGGPDALRDPVRLSALAAATSMHAAASSIGELHHRKLPLNKALALAAGALGSRAMLRSEELRDRVAARFPSLPLLPKRPHLHDLLVDVPLRWDDERKLYVSTARLAAGGTELQSREHTQIVVDRAAVSALGVPGQRLADSLKHRSFLALGVHASHLTKMAAVLAQQHDVQQLNLSAMLMAALKEQAAAKNVPWDAVLTADAAPGGSRASQGIAALIQASFPAVTDAIEQALQGDAPVYLTDASLFAKHGGMKLLSGWIDLSTPRAQALWLEVPQLHANQGPVIELRPLPLSAPSQYLSVDTGWIDQQNRKDAAS